MSVQKQLCIALDVNSSVKAWEIVEKTCHVADCYKIGHELITAGFALSIMRMIRGLGKRVFYDMKYHDAQTTVVRGVEEAVNLGADFISVHATCGPRTLAKLAKAKGSSRILAVTVLTTYDDDDSYLLYRAPVRKLVERWGRMAIESGACGLISSVYELDILQSVGSTFNVTPGIRFSNDVADEQKRSATPTQAIRAGSNLLVVGRSITAPRQDLSVSGAATLIACEISSALEERG